MGFGAGSAKRAVQRPIGQMNGRTEIGFDAQRACRATVAPERSDIIAEEALIVQGALAEGISPGHGKPLRNIHLLAVSGIQDVLQAGIGIDFGQVG